MKCAPKFIVRRHVVFAEVCCIGVNTAHFSKYNIIGKNKFTASID